MEASPPPLTPWQQLTDDVRGAGRWGVGVLRDGPIVRLVAWWHWSKTPPADARLLAQLRDWRGPLWILHTAAAVFVPISDGPDSAVVKTVLWSAWLWWVLLDAVQHGLPGWMAGSVFAALLRWRLWWREVRRRPLALLDWIWR